MTLLFWCIVWSWVDWWELIDAHKVSGIWAVDVIHWIGTFFSPHVYSTLLLTQKTTDCGVQLDAGSSDEHRLVIKHAILYKNVPSVEQCLKLNPQMLLLEKSIWYLLPQYVFFDVMALIFESNNAVMVSIAA